MFPCHLYFYFSCLLGFLHSNSLFFIMMKFQRFPEYCSLLFSCICQFPGSFLIGQDKLRVDWGSQVTFFQNYRLLPIGSATFQKTICSLVKVISPLLILCKVHQIDVFTPMLYCIPVCKRGEYKEFEIVQPCEKEGNAHFCCHRRDRDKTAPKFGN